MFCDVTLLIDGSLIDINDEVEERFILHVILAAAFHALSNAAHPTPIIRAVKVNTNPSARINICIITILVIFIYQCVY